MSYKNQAKIIDQHLSTYKLVLYDIAENRMREHWYLKYFGGKDCFAIKFKEIKVPFSTTRVKIKQL